MKILLLDPTHDLLPKLLEEAGHTCTTGYELNLEETIHQLKSYDGFIIRSKFPVNRDFLSQVQHLKFIGRFGSGLENIDLKAAEEYQIECINAPEGNREAVAEHALGLLLSLYRNIPRAYDEVKKGQWKRKENMGFEISGKTIGIIGYGHMGSAFGTVMSGFQSPILVHDKYKEIPETSLIKSASLKEIQEKADIVSLHIPLTDETIFYADDEFFEGFKKPITYISTCRGKVTQTASLVKAIKKGSVNGACLDVLEYEKSSFTGLMADKSNEDLEFLTTSEKVILSPHIAGWTYESFEKMAQVLAKKINLL